MKNPNRQLPGLGGRPRGQRGQAPTLPGLGAEVNVNAQKVQTGYQLERIMNEAIEHHKAGRREDAERLYRTVLQQIPDQPDALNLLGVLAVDGGRKEIAVDLMMRAMLQRPMDASIQNNLGNALFQMRRYDEAIEHLEQAVVLKEDFTEALFNLGKTIRMQGDLAEARHYYERVLKINPQHVMSTTGIARTWEDEGDMERAEEGYRQTMTAYPDRAAGFRGLSHIKKWKGGDPEIAQMIELFEAEDARPRERVGFAYALGKIHDDLKEFDKAFYYYKFANDNSGIEHDHDATVKNYDEIIRVFNKKFFEKHFGHGHPSKSPIFVVGMPRSGTSLTEQIFAGHKDVFGAGELEYMARTMRRAQAMSGSAQMGPAAYNGLSKESWRILGNHYLKLVERKAPHAKHVVDKMPHNYEQLGLIALTMPNAKIIHIKRQGPDNCLSCFMQDFNEFHSYNRDLRNAGLYYRQYERLTNHWAEVLPIPIFQLCYEELVRNPEETVRKMLDFCELEWDPNCMNFHKLKRNVVTPSNTQVRQPMYQRSADRWRNYEKDLGPLLEALEWEGRTEQKGAAE